MKNLPAMCCLVFLPAATLSAAGFATSQNFTVFTQPRPSQEDAQRFAEDLLSQAEEYRQDIATTWLGQQLPPGVGRTTINFTFSDQEDSGLTWAKDNSRRKLHTVFLATSPGRAVGSTLAHEMVHVVLATRYPHPHGLPAWIEEGIASRYDDAERQQKREQILTWIARTGNWPSLSRMIRATNLHGNDAQSYAVAASLTEFLLSLENRQRLLAFGQTAKEAGSDAALRQHYQIQDLSQLQDDWQAWAAKSPSLTAKPRPIHISQYGKTYVGREVK